MTPSMVNESERIRLERIAAGYQAQGYDVTLQPRPADLPDFLAGFSPNLVASGKGETVVVEVMTRGELSDAPFAAGLEAALRDRPGWRFEFVIDGTSVETSQTLSVTQIRALLEEAAELEQRKHPAAAVLVLWSATEDALRLLANRENVELKSLAAGYVVTRLYTLGLLGREQYQTLDATMRLRNRAAHGFQARVTPEILTNAAAVLNGLLDEVEVKAA